MLKNALKRTFNEASFDSGRDCLINYVWINNKADKDSREAACSVSLSHLDCAYENARNYKDARVKIWLDYRYLDDRSRSILLQHYDRFAPSNAELCDLNDISDYHQDDIFATDTNKSIWARVDLARLIVLDHALKNEPERHCIYADFDVRDVKIHTAKAIMDKQGLALGTTGAQKHALVRLFNIEHGSVENGYFAFKKGEKGPAFLKKLLTSTFDAAVENMNGYSPLKKVSDSWSFKNSLDIKKDLCVRNVLYGVGYEIPEKRRYKRWGWR